MNYGKYEKDVICHYSDLGPRPQCNSTYEAQTKTQYLNLRKWCRDVAANTSAKEDHILNSAPIFSALYAFIVTCPSVSCISRAVTVLPGLSVPPWRVTGCYVMAMGGKGREAGAMGPGR